MHQLTAAGPFGRLCSLNRSTGVTAARVWPGKILGSSLSGAGDQVTKGTEKSLFLIAFCVWVLSGKICLQESWAPEKVWNKDELPLVEEDQIREHLNRPDIQRSILIRYTYECWWSWPVSPWGHFWIYLESSWGLGESKCHSYLREKAILSSIPEKIMQQLILDNISKHMKDEKVAESHQHGFTKGKFIPHQRSLSSWHDVSVDGGKTRRCCLSWP